MKVTAIGSLWLLLPVSVAALAIITFISIASAVRTSSSESPGPEMPTELRGKTLHTILETTYKPSASAEIKEGIEESWWEIGIDGEVTRGYVVVTDRDGSLEQQGFVRDGAVYNHDVARNVMTVNREAHGFLEVVDLERRAREGYLPANDPDPDLTRLTRESPSAKETFYLHNGVRVGIDFRVFDSAGIAESFYLRHPVAVETVSYPGDIWAIPLPDVLTVDVNAEPILERSLPQ